MVYEETGLHGNLPSYLINPETTFSKVKDVWVQSMTWTNLIITPVAFVFHETAGETAIVAGLEWIVDIAWSIEILMSFITADFNNRTFKSIACDYLKFWFWIDALSTFPAMVFYQKQRYVNLLKFLRILHFFELFSPFRLMLEVIMRDAIRKTIDNVY